MSVKAVAKGINMSPRKVGVVAALVRGQTVDNAITILEHTPRRSADTVKRVVESAKANAENNHNLKPGSLYISEISVGHGPRFKRFRPAARGRALPYQLKTSHIRVVVDGEKRVSKKQKSITESKPVAKQESK